MSGRTYTFALLCLLGAAGLDDDAAGQSVIHLHSGYGSPGGGDALVSFVEGPIDSAFPRGSLGPSLFSAAASGPQALITSSLAANWLPTLPSEPLAKWIGTSLDPWSGASAVFAVSFLAPSNTVGGKLSIELAVDNLLGTDTEQGLWLNGSPIPGSQLIGPHGVDYYSVVSNINDLDISGLVKPGSNTLYLYCADSGLAAGIMFSATITLTGWASAGPGLAGTGGMPTLSGTGALEPGTAVNLQLSAAKAFALTWLVAGVAPLNAPFKGGIMVPSPDLLFVLTTDFFGGSSFGGLWPAGVPSGFTTYFQWWIQDPAGPKGFAASNALAGTTP